MRRLKLAMRAPRAVLVGNEIAANLPPLPLLKVLDVHALVSVPDIGDALDTGAPACTCSTHRYKKEEHTACQ